MIRRLVNTDGIDCHLVSACPLKYFRRFRDHILKTLDRLDGLMTVHDDMAKYGCAETDKEASAGSWSNRRLEAFLLLCREKGMKLNRNKLKLRCAEISYQGNLVMNDGLKLTT